MNIPFHASSAETTSGNSASFGTGNMGLIGLFVDVTAKSGTLPTLVVSIQQSPDGNVWYDVPSLTTSSLNSIISVSVSATNIVPLADYVRCKWVIGGVGPSFTFTADLAVYSL